MQHPEIDEDFLKFESKVDEVMRILQDVAVKPTTNAHSNSEAPVGSKQMLTPTYDVDPDDFIVTVRDNRTVINKDSKDAKADTLVSSNCQEMDKFTFMQQVEKDAEERAQARKERERIAQNFRTLGNNEYRKGNYEKAILHYTKAIEHIKDSAILYSNRALCYIKLQNHKRAIIDCDYVLNKLDEKNMRAWLYRAAAYKRLGDEQNYETCVKFARKYNSKQLEQINQFLAKIPTDL